MTKLRFPMVMEPARGGGYGVFFPDFDGCVSYGDDADQAYANAFEALSLHIEGMVEDGDEIPAASRLDQVTSSQADLLAKGGLVALIEVTGPDASERVNVYLPKALLDRIDRYTDAHGLNRSSFFGAAASQVLAAGGRDMVELGGDGDRMAVDWAPNGVMEAAADPPTPKPARRRRRARPRQG